MRRDLRGALGAERMADDDDTVGGMRAGIRGKFAVLFEAAIGDDVAALAQPGGDRGEPAADKQAVHDIGAGGRPSFMSERVGSERGHERQAAKDQAHRSTTADNLTTGNPVFRPRTPPGQGPAVFAR